MKRRRRDAEPHPTPAGAAATARAGRLYVVATPLGNLGDMTFRAVEALRASTLVACEDTRRTRALLSHFGLSVPTISCHRFNETARSGEILAALREGRSVALVTDAGTPGVSDPGARLVAEAASAGIAIEAIPGPSAPSAAISIGGFESGGFVFAGFAPSRPAARRRFLEGIAASEAARSRSDPSATAWPLVFFEAPHRIEACLSDIGAVLGDRRVVAIRELTKMHEEILRGTVSGILAALAARPRKGEFTIVVEGRLAAAKVESTGERDLKSAYRELIAAGVERREALKRLSRSTGARRRDVYRAVAGAGSDEEE